MELKFSNLEELVPILTEMATRLGVAEEKAAEAVAAAGDATKKAKALQKQLQSLTEQGVTNTALTVASKTPVSAPKKPESPIEHNEKSYVWNVATFSLPGDPNKYTAEEASTEVNKDGGLIERILAIKGQRILVEQA